jgi:hypothetical protein
MVTSNDGASGEATVHQEVNNVAPTVVIEPGLGNTDPNFISLVAVATDPGSTDTIILTGSALPVGGSPGLTQTGSGANILVDHSRAPGALWKVTVTAVDNDDDQTVFFTALLVGTNGDDVGANRLIVTDTIFVQAETTELIALALAGADDDLLINPGPAVTTLRFGGDSGVDTFLNTGTVFGNLTFGGGDGPDSFSYNATGSPISIVTFHAYWFSVSRGNE